MKKRTAGEGSLYKRVLTNGKTQYIAQTPYPECRLFTSTKSQSEAIRKRAEYLKSHPYRKHKKGAHTLTAYLRSWLESVRPSIGPRTYIGYEIIMERHVIPHIGETLLHKVTASDVRKVMTILADKPVTARHTRRALRQAFTHAINEGLIHINPVDKTKPPKAPKTNIRPLYADELTAWLDFLSKRGPYTAVAEVLTLTGLRLGEVMGLEWKDVDFAKRTIHVRQSIQRFDRTSHIVPTKTTESQRTIEVAKRVIETLRVHRKAQLEARIKAGPVWGWKGHDFVFPSQIGTPEDKTNLSRKIHALMKAAGIPKRRIHDLRHTCATTMLRNGVPIKTVQAYLGHSTPTTTLAIYGHVIPGDIGHAASVIDRIAGE